MFLISSFSYSDDLSVLPWIFNPSIDDPVKPRSKGLEKFFRQNFSIEEHDSIIQKKSHIIKRSQGLEEKPPLEFKSFQDDHLLMERNAMQNREELLGIRSHRSEPEASATRLGAKQVLAKYGLDSNYRPVRSQSGANATVS